MLVPGNNDFHPEQRRFLEENICNQQISKIKHAVLYSITGEPDDIDSLALPIWTSGSGEPLPELPGRWGMHSVASYDDDPRPLLTFFRAAGALPEGLGQVLCFTRDFSDSPAPLGGFYKDAESIGIWTDDFCNSSGNHWMSKLPPDMPSGTEYTTFGASSGRLDTNNPRAFVWVEKWGGPDGKPAICLERPDDAAVKNALAAIAATMLCQGIMFHSDSFFSWDDDIVRTDIIYDMARVVSLGNLGLPMPDGKEPPPPLLLAKDMLLSDELETVRSAAALARCGQIWGRALVENGVAADWGGLTRDGVVQAGRLATALGISEEISAICNADHLDLVPMAFELLEHPEKKRSPEDILRAIRRDQLRISAAAAVEDPPKKKGWFEFLEEVLGFAYGASPKDELESAFELARSEMHILAGEPLRLVGLPGAAYPAHPGSKSRREPCWRERGYPDGPFRYYDDGLPYIPDGPGMVMLVAWSDDHGVDTLLRCNSMTLMASMLSEFDDIEWLYLCNVPAPKEKGKSNAEIAEFARNLLGDRLTVGYCNLGSGDVVDGLSRYEGKTFSYVGPHAKLLSLDGLRPDAVEMLQKAHDSESVSAAGEFPEKKPFSSEAPPKGSMSAVIQTVSRFVDASDCWTENPWEFEGEEIPSSILSAYGKFLPADAAELGLVKHHPLEGRENEINDYVKLLRYSLRQANLSFLAASGNRLDEDARPVSQAVLDYAGSASITAFEAGVDYEDIVSREVTTLR